MRCATHPEVETNLKCGKCGKPICPRCMVETPVGAKCPDCAKMYKLPTYQVSTKFYLRAIGAGLGMAIACGFVWGVVERVIPFFSFNLLLAPAVGYAIGEVISRSVNRKRGTRLAVIAGIALVISYLTGILSPWGFHFRLFDLLAIALGIYVTVTRLR